KAHLRLSDELLDLGLSLIEQAGELEGANAAIVHRDGLIIALLALVPLRRRNLAGLRLDHNLIEVGGSWLITLDASETKTHAALDVMWPDELVAPLVRYLEVHRPLLASLSNRWSRPVDNALWVSSHGSPMTEIAMYDRIRRHTQNRHGPSMHTVPMSTRSSVRGSSHEASTAKRGVPRPSRKPSKAARRKEVRVMFPEPESWANIVHDCKLTNAQANKLQITVQEALDDIDLYYSKLRNRPSREGLVARLKRFEKCLKRLQNECQRSDKLMESFLPFDTLGFIGQSLTFSAMSEALGRDVFPNNYDFQIDFKRSQGKQITLESVEQDTWPMREA